jgi:exodeoxyribonuclease V alpha subunit
MSHELNQKQRDAVEAGVHAEASILTGGPGTGKTTTVKAIVEALRKDDQRALLLAPTGKAALRMQSVIGLPASTIHRAIRSQNVRELFGRHSVAIVDEASMVCSELGGEFASHVVASGIRVIFVGDKDQLPPVGPGRPFEDAVNSGVVPTVVLDRVYRQHAKSWVLDNAYKILAGEMVDLENQEDFRFIETNDATASAIDYIADKWEKGIPSQEFQIITPQRVDSKTKDTGATTERINTLIQENMEPDEPGEYAMEWGKVLKNGDRVIQTTNNYIAGVVNGQLGNIIKATSEGVLVKFDESFGDNNEGVWYADAPGNLSIPDPSELDLAYGITVHKSQGSQWPHVAFIADERHSSMLQRRLFYTAVTRTERFLTIIGSRGAVARAVSSSRNDERNTLFEQKLRGELAFRGSHDIPKL